MSGQYNAQEHFDKARSVDLVSVKHSSTLPPKALAVKMTMR